MSEPLFPVDNWNAETESSEPQVIVTDRPAEKEETDQRNKTKKQPPYVVIIHNDDYHTWPYVIDVLQRVCGHNRTRAYQLTAQIHFHGRAHVWSGALEVAELKRDQIRAFGPDLYASVEVKFPLGVSIEPLPGD